MSAADVAPAAGSREWCAQWRVEPETAWTECRVLDVTLSGALIEVADEAADDPPVGETCHLQIDSIAADEVGVSMRAIVTGSQRAEQGRLVVEVEFDARREERLLLHLLVRLHALV